MSEKLKPNFTPVPNVILDEIMCKLSPGALKVLFAICRFTYGWGKQSDRISLSQLQEITGMARGSVARSLKQLGALVTIQHGDPSQQQASEYRLNVEISAEDLVSLRDQPLVSKRDQASLRASLPGETFQRKPKKEEKSGAKAPFVSSPSRRERIHTRRGDDIPPELQATVSRIVAKINELGGTHYRDDSPDALHNLLARLRDGRTEAECFAVVDGRHAAWADKKEMQEHFRPSTLFAAKHFEDYLQAAQRDNSHAESNPDRRKELFING